jgi:hypothetical protein
MPVVKWTTFSEIEPERDYLVFIEMGERKSVWSYFSFLMRARKVAQQLKTAKGVIGIRGRLGFLNREVVMVAVFEDENSLTEFAHSGQHANCMEVTKQDIKGKMKTARWSISGSELPPKLDDAINRAKNK